MHTFMTHKESQKKYAEKHTNCKGYRIEVTTQQKVAKLDTYRHNLA